MKLPYRDSYAINASAAPGRAKTVIFDSLVVGDGGGPSGRLELSTTATAWICHRGRPPRLQRHRRTDPVVRQAFPRTACAAATPRLEPSPPWSDRRRGRRPVQAPTGPRCAARG